MKYSSFVIICFLASQLQACSQPKQASTNTAETTLAFPGAEGFGKYTIGGRGGKIIPVTNLDDSGPGSFREAVTAKGPRIVILTVSGTIHLNSSLSIKGNVTIAGQSAPGDGICLADYPVILGGDNIIIRYMRFRMGDKNQKGGMVDGNGGDDAFGSNRRKNIIIDHCSMSWSTDEVFSLYGGDSTTLQWNIISEPMNYSYHFETGDKDYEHHGYGGIWGGSHLSAHHNLFAHCNSRNPRFNGTRLGATEELVDYRNNVIYNWGGNTVYGGEGGQYNIVGNYYRYGPSTSKGVRFRVLNPFRQEKPEIGFGKFFVEGNFVDGAEDVSSNNWLGIVMNNNGTEADKKEAIVSAPFLVLALPVQTAKDAYDQVLKLAGASFARDTLDMRIISDVKNRTGGFIDVQGGFPHGTSYDLTVGAWPALRTISAKKDSDKDGIPDQWESAHGLNPSNAKDASRFSANGSYTNIELYLNSLLQ
ncbi:MAG TPA: hypothetical protein VK644_08305 [Chitinophagaceae bacterium]|nr:hypothetical protein [Chitinophagaceae bacterium]